MEHTPGEWELDRGQHTTAIAISKEGAEEERFGARLIAFTYNENHLANATLFWAAPDLLAACEAWIELGQRLDFRMFLAQAPETTAIFTATDAAITKAKGEQP